MPRRRAGSAEMDGWILLYFVDIGMSEIRVDGRQGWLIGGDVTDPVRGIRWSSFRKSYIS